MLRQVLDMIGQGFFSPDEPDRYAPIARALLDDGEVVEAEDVRQALGAVLSG